MFNRCRMLLAAALTTMLVVGVSAFAASSEHRRVAVTTISLASPLNGAGLSGSRPLFSGAARGESRRVLVKLWEGHTRRGRPDRILTTRRSGSSYAVRPAHRLRAGTYTARARPVGAGGKAGSSEIPTFKVKVSGPDRTAPDTTITSGPSGTITTDSASFGLSSSEADSTLECKLDSGSFASCPSPKAYSSLATGAHTFSARAIDAASNTDATPANRSFTVDTAPSGAPATIPGTGAIISQDRANNPDPVPLWKQIAAADPAQGAGNTRVFQNEYAGITASPDPHPTIQGSTTDTFRRFRVDENDQYSGDVRAGNTSERAQLVRNSETNSFYTAHDGDHSITYVSVRMQGSPTPAWGSGQAGESQLLQFKPAGPGIPFLISIQEKADSLLLRHNYNRSPQTLWTSGQVVKGQWIRLALDIEWAEQGSITVWGDVDGGSQELVQLSPTMNVRTIPADLYPQTLSVGVYQDRSAPALWRDYANIQVAEAN